MKHKAARQSAGTTILVERWSEAVMAFAVFLLTVEIVGVLIALGIMAVKLFGSKSLQARTNGFLDRHWPRWIHS